MLVKRKRVNYIIIKRFFDVRMVKLRIVQRKNLHYYNKYLLIRLKLRLSINYKMSATCQLVQYRVDPADRYRIVKLIITVKG